MLRESRNSSLHWADKTWSVLHARQLEASEDKLYDWPVYNLFENCDDLHAESLWEISFMREERPLISALHTCQELRDQVLQLLPDEAVLLSPDELKLVERMVFGDGTAELLVLEDSVAAEPLIRRLWCSMEWADEDRAYLHMPQALVTRLQPVMSSPRFEDQVASIFALGATIHAILYLDGGLAACDVLPQLRSSLPDRLSAESFAVLSRRWLKTSFDYIWRNRQMILIHPGLAEADSLVLQQGQPDLGQLSPEKVLGAAQGLLPEENPLFDQLTRLITNAVRPELTPEEAAADLMILAKQGVPIQAMREVLATLLTVQPTPAMLDTVAQLSMQIPRWPGFGSVVLH